ncbi:MAG: NAD-dependent epimerase/dehydratase family protein [Bacteroidales bacterium]|nr:NAD-dependent epimerase/dehydratase family protein [Bacteroidales bacterium]
MILVTGGTGLLGSHLLFDLTNAGKKVKAIKRTGSQIHNVYKTFRFYTKTPEKLLDNIEWTTADLLDYQSLEKAFENVKQVYHCAGLVSFEKSKNKLILKNNIEGTTNIVNISLEKKIDKFCHVSSIATFGAPNEDNLINEQSQWNDNENHSFYSISKYKAEMEVWRGIAEGLNAVIINPSVILGPGDWKKGTTQLFPLIWKGNKYCTNGVNGFIDVRDVCEIMINLMNGKIRSERFIVSSENLSYKQLLSYIAESLGKKIPNISISKLVFDIVYKYNSLLSKISGKEPVITNDTARISFQKSYYSNQKIIDAINVDFIPIKESINQIALKFLKDYLKDNK